MTEPNRQAASETTSRSAATSAHPFELHTDYVVDMQGALNIAKRRSERCRSRPP
jgi:hypothetical protein